MGVEHQPRSGRDNVNDVAAQGRDGMGGRCHRSHNPEGREFFHGDPMVAAQAVGVQPFHTRDQLDYF